MYKSPTDKVGVENKYGSSLHLRIDNWGKTATMCASKDGIEWDVICENIDIADIHHNKLGEFISLRPGLCSFGAGEAQFHEFSYTPID